LDIEFPIWEYLAVLLIGTVLFGVLLLVAALIFRPFRRYLMLSFAAPPSTLFLWVIIYSGLPAYLCGYPEYQWPKYVVLPVWILSTLIVWWLIYLFQLWLNKKHPFFGAKRLPEERSDLTTLEL
jgi:hypothetical protein